MFNNSTNGPFGYSKIHKMASTLRKWAIGGLAGTAGAGLAMYAFLREDQDARVSTTKYLPTRYLNNFNI